MILLLYSLSFSALAHAFTETIDLHAHAVIQSGVGPLIRGSFYEPPRSERWDQTFSTKLTQQTLLGPTRISILVASLYAHPILSIDLNPKIWTWDSKRRVADRLEKQYLELDAWVRDHPNDFGWARNAKQARSLNEAKKTAVVLSIEGAFGALETEDDFKKWVDDRGLAIVTPFHLTEDHFSGTALMHGVRALNSPREFLARLFSSGFDCLKTFCTGTIGVTPIGKDLIDRLIRRSVWIDVAHANEISWMDLGPALDQAEQPLLNTHTQTREFFQAERGLGNTELAHLRKHDGIVGLIPSEDLITEWNNNSETCRSGIDTFQKSIAELEKKIGPERIAFGSDVNAPLNGLSPRCSIQPKSLAVEKTGFYRYDQLSELFQAVRPGVDAGSIREHFLKLWNQVRK